MLHRSALLLRRLVIHRNCGDMIWFRSCEVRRPAIHWLIRGQGIVTCLIDESSRPLGWWLLLGLGAARTQQSEAGHCRVDSDSLAEDLASHGTSDEERGRRKRPANMLLVIFMGFSYNHSCWKLEQRKLGLRFTERFTNCNFQIEIRKVEIRSEPPRVLIIMLHVPYVSNKKISQWFQIISLKNT